MSVSSAINPDSAAGQAYQYAVAYYDLFTSEETIAELEAVLLRDKFDVYFSRGGPSRERFIADYRQVAQLIPVLHTVYDCSDPKDNKFLALAISAKADMLVTGDKKHLLPMHPYHKVSIVTIETFCRGFKTSIF